MYWTFYNSVILFLLKIKVYCVERELLGMTITIQVSKGWVSLTHIMAKRAYKPRTEYFFLIKVLYAHISSLTTQSGGQKYPEGSPSSISFFFTPIKSKWFLHNYQRPAILKINNKK